MLVDNTLTRPPPNIVVCNDTIQSSLGQLKLIVFNGITLPKLRTEPTLDISFSAFSFNKKALIDTVALLPPVLNTIQCANSIGFLHKREDLLNIRYKKKCTKYRAFFFILNKKLLFSIKEAYQLGEFDSLVYVTVGQNSSNSLGYAHVDPWLDAEGNIQYPDLQITGAIEGTINYFYKPYNEDNVIKIESKVDLLCYTTYIDIYKNMYLTLDSNLINRYTTSSTQGAFIITRLDTNISNAVYQGDGADGGEYYEFDNFNDALNEFFFTEDIGKRIPILVSQINSLE